MGQLLPRRGASGCKIWQILKVILIERVINEQSSTKVLTAQVQYHDFFLYLN